MVKNNNAYAETENNNANAEKFKAVIKEDKPTYKRGDKINMIGKEGIQKVTIRNIYSRRLEDLTFSDLDMVGYTNPNLFVKEWEQDNGSFDENLIVWVVVYVDKNMEEEE